MNTPGQRIAEKIVILFEDYTSMDFNESEQREYEEKVKSVAKEVAASLAPLVEAANAIIWFYDEFYTASPKRIEVLRAALAAQEKVPAAQNL